MNHQHNSVWLTRSDCDIEDFRKLTSADYPQEAMPLAVDIQQRIPVYSGNSIAENSDNADYIAQSLLTKNASANEFNQALDSWVSVQRSQ